MRYLLMTVLAALAFSAAADTVQFRNDAPERYTVKKGDTLWDISARFLKSPWKWPEVWQLNRAQIKNPHLIYPGDVVLLRDGKLVLERGLPTVKLSPQVRSEAIVTDAAIPSVPYEAIAPMLNQGGIVAAGELDAAPRILGSRDERVLFGAGDQVYANANDPNVARWEIVRLGKPVIDPDSGETLGHQLEHVGLMRLSKAGQPATFEIERTSQEVADRDRLRPHAGQAAMHFVPHAPSADFSGRVVTTLGGLESAALQATVVLNRGRDAGLEPGHVLGVFRAGKALDDPRCKKAKKIAFFAASAKPTEADCQVALATPGLPQNQVGLVFVYRVFERTAYALVVQSSEPIYPRDTVKAP